MSQQSVSFGNSLASKPFAKKFAQGFMCISFTAMVVEVIGPVKELQQRFWTMELCSATALI